MITAAKKTDAGNCLSCGRANFESSFGTKKEVEELVAITVTPDSQQMSFVQTFCPDCLAKLAQAIQPFRASLAV